MTDTMRERMARELCREANASYTDEPCFWSRRPESVGRCNACVATIDAILSVMEDPSEAAIDAGRTVIRGKSTLRETAVSGWRAMIAAIKAGA